MMRESLPLRLSVIVPAHRCAAMLRRSLQALHESDLPRERWELIVVDDASGDDTPVAAAEFADRIVPLAAPARGPAFARNRGAEAATGQVLVFVDADVTIHPHVLRGFAEHFAANERLGAVFGAYDTDPPAPGVVSQYRNLLHHYVHASNAGPAVTFWAGCGAVLRSAFEQAGGFDERRYTRPQIEDIELGHRLDDLGWQILLDPTLQGTHLKQWTLFGGLRTDIRDRGIPWVLLLLAERERGARTRALNFQPAEKVYAALVALAVAGALMAIASADWRWLMAGAVALAVVLVGNWPLLRWMARRRGAAFAVAIVPLRVLYYLVSAWCVAAGVARHAVRRERLRERAGEPIAPGRSSAQLEC